MELSLENTQITFYIKLGDSECILTSIRYGLCDNQWHTVKITREGIRIILQVDNDEPSTSMLDHRSFIEKDMKLNFDFLEIGFSTRKIFSSMYNYLSYESIDIASNFLQHRTNGQIDVHSSGSFDGQMQQLIINGKSYFEEIDNGNLYQHVNRTATFLRSEIPNMQPLKFSDNSWISVPKIDASHFLLIQFNFKTTHQNGLIVFNKGLGEDFLAIELVNGQIRFLFSLDSKIKVLESNLKDKLNNNKWHLVSIWRSTKTNFELTVDSVIFKLSLKTLNENLELNLVDDLYIGGYKENYFSLLKEKYNLMSECGFKGCLASFEINGRAPDFDLSFTNSDKINGIVTKGCENDFDCFPNVCKNGGLCIEKWEENSIFCDCDETTYTGNFCEKRSIGFEIDSGIIHFDYKSPFYWQEDILTFAIETETKDALLFRAYSGRSNKTIIVEINDGFVQAIFVDIHATIYLHSFKNYRINDKKYHKIHMKVFDFDSYLYVDDNAAKKEIISDKKYNPFKKYEYLPYEAKQNSINVEIAGSKYFSNSSENPNEVHFLNNFRGNIFGLVYNKFRILDLLSLKDQRIRTIGTFNIVQEDFLNEIENDHNLTKEHETKNDKYNSIQIKDEIKLDENGSEKTTKQNIMTNPENIDYSSFDHDIANSNQLKDSFFSTNYIILITFGSLVILIVLIYAFCKYRSLNEGTYTIDETKNCGPFAELDTPLNSSSTSGRKIKNKRKIMLNANNKEWFV